MSLLVSLIQCLLVMPCYYGYCRDLLRFIEYTLEKLLRHSLYQMEAVIRFTVFFSTQAFHTELQALCTVHTHTHTLAYDMTGR